MSGLAAGSMAHRTPIMRRRRPFAAKERRSRAWPRWCPITAGGSSARELAATGSAPRSWRFATRAVFCISPSVLVKKSPGPPAARSSQVFSQKGAGSCSSLATVSDQRRFPTSWWHVHSRSLLSRLRAVEQVTESSKGTKPCVASATRHRAPFASSALVGRSSTHAVVPGSPSWLCLAPRVPAALARGGWVRPRARSEAGACRGRGPVKAEARQAPA